VGIVMLQRPGMYKKTTQQAPRVPLASCPKCAECAECAQCDDSSFGVRENKVNQCAESTYETKRYKDGITVTTHLSADRFDRLVSFAHMYDGPIAAVILVRSAGEEALMKKRWKGELDGSRVNMNLWRHPCWMQDIPYPINFLRNLVMESVETEWALMLDVDFVPAANLHAVLVQVLYTQFASKKERFVVAVPAMEGRENASVPKRIGASELHALVKAESVKPSLAAGPFDSVDDNWPPAHVEFIDYEKWYGAKQPYRVSYKDMANEPYLAVKMADPCTPKYDERFLHYGNDKCEWVHHLNATGVQFWVAPQEAFVLHLHHPKKQWALAERAKRAEEVEAATQRIIEERSSAEFLSAIEKKGCRRVRL